MNTEKFYYSKWNAWGSFVYVAVFGSIFYYNHTVTGRPLFLSQWEIAALVILALILIYRFFRVLLPMLRRKTFMELDDEKIDIKYKNKIVYWKDIKEITSANFFNGIIIKLKNTKNIKVNLNDAV